MDKLTEKWGKKSNKTFPPTNLGNKFANTQGCLASSVWGAPLDLEVVSLSPTLDVEIKLIN